MTFRSPADFAALPRDRGEDVIGRVVDDGLHGVEAQTIEMEFIDPIAGIGDEKLPDRPGVGLVEVDRAAPVGFVMPAVESVREHVEVVVGRAEVVIDHVENHAEPEAMRLVDEAAEIIGAAI